MILWANLGIPRYWADLAWIPMLGSGTYQKSAASEWIWAGTIQTYSGISGRTRLRDSGRLEGVLPPVYSDLIGVEFHVTNFVQESMSSCQSHTTPQAPM